MAPHALTHVAIRSAKPQAKAAKLWVLRIGFVQEVHPYGEHRERAMEIARQICKCAPLGLRATKKAALIYLEQGERAAIDAIPSIRKTVFATEDFKEGIQSFIERREARFQGR